MVNLECVISRLRDDAIELDIHPVDYRLLKPDLGLLESVLVRLGEPIALGLSRNGGVSWTLTPWKIWPNVSLVNIGQAWGRESRYLKKQVREIVEALRS